MEKNCTLVKKVVELKDKDGNPKKNEKGFVIRVTNYYLMFENGDLVPVECKRYVTQSKDKKDIDKIEMFNRDNYVRFDTHAFKVEE